jgi:hypothetical protein
MCTKLKNEKKSFIISYVHGYESLSNYGFAQYYVNKFHPLLSISFSFQMDS